VCRVCTLVCRWRPEEPAPLQLLALRDEYAHRDFDLPDAWWPELPNVIGGRDRRGGGTWCATDVASGVTAVVLNGGDERKAEPGAASRGALPLQALAHGRNWPAHLDIGPMASFNLVLATAEALTWWSYHGEGLQVAELTPGVHLFTPRGLAESIADERLTNGQAQVPTGQWDATLGGAGTTEALWAQWLPVITDAEPSEDPLAMLVEHTVDEKVFQTVFGQFILAEPGRLRLDYTVVPAKRNPWTVAHWPQG
jgi:hypothetical protein